MKVAGKEAECCTDVEKLMKYVDLEEPTSLFDHVYLGRSQRECKPNETIIEEYTDVRVTYFCWSNRKNSWEDKSHVKQLHGPMTWKDTPKIRRKVLRTGKQES